MPVVDVARVPNVHHKSEKQGEQIMKWVPTLVNLDKHIHIPDVDQNMESPDKFVEDYISNLTKTTMDMSGPLWDLHLLNVTITNAEAVGVFRIHHSLGDGVSLMSLLLACTRQTSNPNALPSIPRKNVVIRKKPNRLWRLLKAIWMMWVIFQLMWNTFMDMVVFMCTSIFLKDTETPFKGAPGVELTPKRIVHRTVSLDDIKLVKNAMNMTINDVVLGVTAAGLSRYLNRRYGEGKKDKGSTQKKNNLRKYIRLRATLLVNIRPSVGIQALADMMDKGKSDAKWGNWMGYVLLPFNIGLRDDPLDYVREAKAIIDRKKLSLEAIYTFSCGSFIVNSLGTKAASALSNKILANTTMSFSNIVGPLEEISFYGHPMVYLAPSVYGHPHGLTIHLQSYLDKMTIVLTVDEKCVPDPHQLCDDLEESLKLIKGTILAGRS
ncbi:hypothetical protein IFM89_013070 [Coptis chinensis]|uniref:Diacylglycerol O-acyltransferase n=1 Tax=Coptis chinensis TaxID=261450 RepID=A0A835LMV5_9MAGN|nr:hypothetical protein IFM89_013070 [Coptis chinensis]